MWPSLFCPTLHASERHYFSHISTSLSYIGQLINSPIQAFLLHLHLWKQFLCQRRCCWCRRKKCTLVSSKGSLYGYAWLYSSESFHLPVCLTCRSCALPNDAEQQLVSSVLKIALLIHSQQSSSIKINSFEITHDFKDALYHLHSWYIIISRQCLMFLNIIDCHTAEILYFLVGST